jgi:polyphosphate kinase 2 (PPK2 family)
MSGKITLKIVARQFQPKKKYKLSEEDVQTIKEL